MICTDRDKYLLKFIQSYGCVTTRQIAAKIFPRIALTTVLRRLRILEEADLIQKIRGLETNERLWAVTPKSLERYLGGPAKLNFPRAILEHDSLLSTIRLKLEDMKAVQSWIPEHVVRSQMASKYGLRAMSEKIVPDGIAGADINGQKESLSIELELTNKNQTRYRNIMFEYLQKKNIWAVWYFVSTRTIMNQILEAKRKAGLGCDPTLMFTIVDDFMNDGINTRILFEDSKRYTIKSVFRLTEPAQLPAQANAQLVSRQQEQSVSSEPDAK